MIETSLIISFCLRIVKHEWYQQTRPHIETSVSPHDYVKPRFQRRGEDLLKRPSIKAVNWSPPFQAPFLVNTGSGMSSPASPYYPQEQDDDIAAFRTYIEAIRYLKTQLERNNAVFEKKLEPGTAVIFNNRRIVHARRAFKNQGGERWLRGAYIDTDVFRSRLRVLEEEEEEDDDDEESDQSEKKRREQETSVENLLERIRAHSRSRDQSQ